MSEVQPIGTQPVRAAIARAAQATGVDFDYLLAQARIESSLDPSARASTSSAAGLYQFTGGTWLQTLDRHGAAHGLDWADAAIEGGRVRDPALREAVMALRFDPAAAALMAGELANDNRAALTGALGREPDAAELYLAHFLGSDGAARLLSADPQQSAVSLFPKPAAANRTIFFAPDGAPRSVGQVVEVIRGKVGRAMGTNSPDPSGAGGQWGLSASTSLGFADRPTPDPSPEEAGLGLRGPLASEFHSGTARPSMAETLRQSFGGGAPGFVRAAYDKLQGFGL